MKFAMYALALGVTIWAAVGAASAQTVSVHDAWARSTVPAQKAGGAYMELTAKNAAKLVSASSTVAGKVEIHNMKIENNVMRMFPVEAIDLPAGKPVKLAPGGYHIMLMELKQPLKAGERIPLRLTIELADRKRETLEVTAEVRDVTGKPGPDHVRHAH